MYTKKINLLFSLLVLGSTSCAPFIYPQPETVSLLDLKYLLKQTRNNSSAEIKTGAIAFYQNYLSPQLNSHCHHYPSDSRFAKELFKKCSWYSSLIQTSARFLSEPDSSKLYAKQVIEKNKIYSIDLPDRCSL